MPASSSKQMIWSAVIYFLWDFFKRCENLVDQSEKKRKYLGTTVCMGK